MTEIVAAHLERVAREANDRMHREQVAFLERHKDADALVCDARLKHCKEAIYLSPMEKNYQAQREFWRPIAEAMRAEEEGGAT